MGKKNPAGLITSENIQRKEYTYVKQAADPSKNITLSFKLRTDIKAEMKSFLELMERATKDIKEDIEKL